MEFCTYCNNFTGTKCTLTNDVPPVDVNQCQILLWENIKVEKQCVNCLDIADCILLYHKADYKTLNNCNIYYKGDMK